MKDKKIVDENSGTIDNPNILPGKSIWDFKEKTVTCFTGPMQKKKRYTIHKQCNWQTKYTLTDENVKAYKNDITRHESMNILDPKCHLVITDEKAKEFTENPDIDFVAPCFYKARGSILEHFGFGRYHRIPYKQSVSNHLPPILKNNSSVDFSESMFGNKELWASRVFFEDAILCNETTEARFQSEDWINPLLAPKPTSYQLYLDQSTASGDKKNNWNTSGVDIRGYKMYWHQRDSNNSWHFQDNEHAMEPSENVNQKIKPLSSGNNFKGRIRFERLCKEELGALLKVLFLGDENICFKIGKGKALGMGSIKVTPKIYLTDDGDTSSSYSSLFCNDGTWDMAGALSIEDVNRYIKSFDDYMANYDVYRTSTIHKDKYNRSINELRAMLNWDNVNNRKWHTETKIMEMNDDGYKNRLKLPTALQVVESSR